MLKDFIRIRSLAVLGCCFLLLLAVPVFAKSKPAPQPAALTPEQQQAAAIADKIFYQEAKLAEDMHKYTPMVETYIQNLKPDPDLGSVPTSDAYFVGRLRLDERGLSNTTFQDKKSGGLVSRVLDRLTNFYRMDYLPLGFMQLLLLNNKFDKDHYDLVYERREFLGDVRTMLFSVKAKPHVSKPFVMCRRD